MLFELPDAYRSEYAEYVEAKKRREEEHAALEAAFVAMQLKVQIGSDKALEALVSQADRLCSMSLTSSNRLLLGPATVVAELEV